MQGVVDEFEGSLEEGSLEEGRVEKGRMEEWGRGCMEAGRKEILAAHQNPCSRRRYG